MRQPAGGRAWKSGQVMWRKRLHEMLGVEVKGVYYAINLGVVYVWKHRSPEKNTRGVIELSMARLGRGPRIW